MLQNTWQDTQKDIENMSFVTIISNLNVEYMLLLLWKQMTKDIPF